MIEHDKVFWHAKSAYFQILSIGLTCPDKEITQAVADGSIMADIKDMLQVTDPPFEVDSDFVALQEGLSCSSKAADLQSVLRREYTELFSAPKDALIPIWETLFLDADGKAQEFGSVLIRSAEAIDARHRYEAANVNMTTQESPDHMRIECEFVGYLCYQIAEAESEEKKDLWNQHLRGFLDSHMDRWFCDFFRRFQEASQHPYFRIISMLGCRIGLAGL